MTTGIEPQFSFAKRVEKKITGLAYELRNKDERSVEAGFHSYTKWFLDELAEEFKLQARGMKGG